MEKNIGRYILRKLTIYILTKNNNFEQSHSAEKSKRGDLLDWEISIMLQNILKIEGGPFRDIKKFSKKNEKSKNKNFEPVSVCRKTWKGRPFGLFQISASCKISKNLKGGPFGDKKNSKKVAQRRKNPMGDPIVSSGLYLTIKME